MAGILGDLPQLTSIAVLIIFGFFVRAQIAPANRGRSLKGVLVAIVALVLVSWVEAVNPVALFHENMPPAAYAPAPTPERPDLQLPNGDYSVVTPIGDFYVNSFDVLGIPITPTVGLIALIALGYIKWRESKRLSIYPSWLRTAQSAS